MCTGRRRARPTPSPTKHTGANGHRTSHPFWWHSGPTRRAGTEFRWRDPHHSGLAPHVRGSSAPDVASVRRRLGRGRALLEPLAVLLEEAPLRVAHVDRPTLDEGPLDGALVLQRVPARDDQRGLLPGLDRRGPIGEPDAPG